MKYLHAMIRTRNLEQSLDFYCNKLGFTERRRKDVENRDIENGCFTLVFLRAPGDNNPDSPEIELAYNHESDHYPDNVTGQGYSFGHLSYLVDNIYELCQRLMDCGITINRPPKDGRMAFVVTPENITLEIIQAGEPLTPAYPWISMRNIGSW